MDLSARDDESRTQVDAIVSQCDDLSRGLSNLLEALSNHPDSDIAVVLSEVALAMEIWQGEGHSHYAHGNERSPLRSADTEILEYLSGAFMQALREIETIETGINQVHSSGVSSR